MNNKESRKKDVCHRVECCDLLQSRSNAELGRRQEQTHWLVLAQLYKVSNKKRVNSRETTPRGIDTLEKFKKKKKKSFKCQPKVTVR